LMQTGNSEDWVTLMASSGTTKERKIKLGILITFWWMVWKKRNRRIF
jgi:hypothetical protein